MFASRKFEVQMKIYNVGVLPSANIESLTFSCFGVSLFTQTKCGQREKDPSRRQVVIIALMLV